MDSNKFEFSFSLAAPLPTLWTDILLWLYDEDCPQWAKEASCQSLWCLPYHSRKRCYPVLLNRTTQHARLSYLPWQSQIITRLSFFSQALYFESSIAVLLRSRHFCLDVCWGNLHQCVMNKSFSRISGAVCECCGFVRFAVMLFMFVDGNW